MTTIALITAMDGNRLIGRNNQLPWRLPADLKHFRQVTFGKPVIMGRSTFESIGAPLDGRRNIVLTRDKTFSAEGCYVVHSLAAAFDAATPAPEVMIIGGSQIYAQFLPLADRLYVTRIEGQTFEGDAWFPQIDEQVWRVSDQQSHLADEKNPYAYTFLIYQRRNSIES